MSDAPNLEHQTWELKDRVIVAGLLGISTAILIALFTSRSLGWMGLVALYSVAVAIPFLAIELIVVGMLISAKRDIFPAPLKAMQYIGIVAAAVGVGATFFQISILAGLIALVSCLYALYLGGLALKTQPLRFRRKPASPTQPAHPIPQQGRSLAEPQQQSTQSQPKQPQPAALLKPPDSTPQIPPS